MTFKSRLTQAQGAVETEMFDQLPNELQRKARSWLNLRLKVVLRSLNQTQPFVHAQSESPEQCQMTLSNSSSQSVLQEITHNPHGSLLDVCVTSALIYKLKNMEKQLIEALINV